MSQEMTNHPLSIMLQVAVPLWIEELRGSDSSVRERIAQEAGIVLQETGEAILFRTRSGESARAFNAVARGIAALAYGPGGISIFGSHWEAA